MLKIYFILIPKLSSEITEWRKDYIVNNVYIIVNIYVHFKGKNYIKNKQDSNKLKQ